MNKESDGRLRYQRLSFSGLAGKKLFSTNRSHATETVYSVPDTMNISRIMKVCVWAWVWSLMWIVYRIIRMKRLARRLLSSQTGSYPRQAQSRRLWYESYSGTSKAGLDRLVPRLDTMAVKEDIVFVWKSALVDPIAVLVIDWATSSLESFIGLHGFICYECRSLLWDPHLLHTSPRILC